MEAHVPGAREEVKVDTRLAGPLACLPEKSDRGRRTGRYSALPGASLQHQHAVSSLALPWQSHLALGGSAVRPQDMRA